MLGCVFYVQFAHETAGAARTRSSLRPLFSEGGMSLENLARTARRDRQAVREKEAPINPTVTSFLYALPTISPAPRGLGAASRVSCCVLGFWPRHCRWLLPPCSRAASCCRVRGPASRYRA